VKIDILELGTERDQIVHQNRIYEAITEGVRQAIWQIATNATGMPCADFYEHIKAGTKEAMLELGLPGNDE